VVIAESERKGDAITEGRSVWRRFSRGQSKPPFLSVRKREEEEEKSMMRGYRRGRREETLNERMMQDRNEKAKRKREGETWMSPLPIIPGSGLAPRRCRMVRVFTVRYCHSSMWSTYSCPSGGTCITMTLYLHCILSILFYITEQYLHTLCTVLLCK